MLQKTNIVKATKLANREKHGKFQNQTEIDTQQIPRIPHLDEFDQIEKQDLNKYFRLMNPRGREAREAPGDPQEAPGWPREAPGRPP